MPVQYKDYYKTLGVPRAASEDEIKRSFRKLAREYHPDVAKNKKQAEEKFKEINEAYEVLGDPAKRKKYDELGPGWNSGADFGAGRGGSPFGRGGSPFPGGQGESFEFQFGGTGFSDFFEQLFGSRRGQAGGFGRGDGFGTFEEGPERGRDVEGDIMVTLEEAVKGSVRTVSLRRSVLCTTCGGTGRKGRGACSACGGSGHEEKTESHQVKIPAGVGEGQLLRVAGRGEAGAGGGASGDLYLRVRLARHPDFEVQGHDLIFTVSLAPWEAVLGAEISVPTMNGSVGIRIPKGTQSGQKLRVRGRGLPIHGGGSGDLIVETKVEMPTQIDDSEKKLWEQMSKSSSFRPRE